jgi:hypothetical protein
MIRAPDDPAPQGGARFWAKLGIMAISFGLVCSAFGQTASTGSVTGVIFDPSKGVLAGARIRLVNEDGGETRSATSDEEGRFGFVQLPPGRYQLQAEKTDSKQLNLTDIQVVVTETLSTRTTPPSGGAFRARRSSFKSLDGSNRHFRIGTSGQRKGG